jgi:hypothetical protein
MSEETQQTTAQAAEETAAAAAATTTQTSESATEGQQESTETQTEGEQKKVTGGFQKRIDKLTREKEFWKEQALTQAKPAGAQQQAGQTEETKPAAETTKPKASDFETHAEFVEALVDWKADEKLKAVRTETAKERARTQQQTAEQAYQAKEKEYKGAVPDFDEVVAAADFPVSRAVLEEIVHGENGPALKYYLASNPEEADRLNKLGPVQLAREVGRLETRFKTAAKAGTTAAVSNAPKPATPATRSASTSTKDPGEMTPGEYRAWRAKQYPNLY